MLPFYNEFLASPSTWVVFSMSYGNKYKTERLTRSGLESYDDSAIVVVIALE